MCLARISFKANWMRTALNGSALSLNDLGLKGACDNTFESKQLQSRYVCIVGAPDEVLTTQISWTRLQIEHLGLLEALARSSLAPEDVCRGAWGRYRRLTSLSLKYFRRRWNAGSVSCLTSIRCLTQSVPSPHSVAISCSISHGTSALMKALGTLHWTLFRKRAAFKKTRRMGIPGSFGPKWTSLSQHQEVHGAFVHFSADSRIPELLLAHEHDDK